MEAVVRLMGTRYAVTGPMVNAVLSTGYVLESQCGGTKLNDGSIAAKRRVIAVKAVKVDHAWVQQ